MHTDTTNTERLAELVRGKRSVLEQLHAVGRRQGELIAGGDVTALLNLLGAKQQLLTGLQQIDRAIEPYRSQDPDARPWPTPNHRAACSADAEACRTLLAAVVEIERANERQMTERRDRLAAQLRQAHTAHGAGDAYRSHASAGSTPPPTTAATSASPGPAAGSLDLTSGA